MDKTLLEMVQERAEEASKKGFSRKVWEIKSGLPSEWHTRKTGIFNRTVQHTFNRKVPHIYGDSPLVIEVTDHRTASAPGGIIISFNREIKYEETFGNGIHSYIPGEWEQEFEKVYQRAKEVIDKRIKELDEAYEQMLRKRFGL